jgi:penicillin-binding protein 2
MKILAVGDIIGKPGRTVLEKYLKKKITRTDLETRILNTSLQGQYAKLGGLNEDVKRELRIKDSIAQLKLKKQNPTPTAVVKKDSTKKN